MNIDKVQEAYANKRQQQQDKQTTATSDKLHKEKLLSSDLIQKAIIKSASAQIEAMASHEPKVEVKNFPKQLNSIKTPDIDKVVKELKNLEKSLSPHNIDFKPVKDALLNLGKKLDTIINTPEKEDVSVNNLDVLKPYFDNVTKSIKSITVSPVVNVKPADVKIKDKPVDIQPIVDSLVSLHDAFKKLSIPDNTKQFKELIKAQASLEDTIANLKFPVPNYVLPFASSTGKATQVVLDSNGSVPVSNAHDTSASGTISTQNLNPNSGTATANSTVALTSLNGTSTLTIQTVGTYTGALTVQTSVNGTNWVSLAGTQILNKNTGLYLATITSALQSTFEVDIAGHKNVRVSANAAVTGSVVVTLNASTADGNTISTVGTVTGVTTVTTLTNLTNWGNIVDNAAFTDGTTRLSPSGYIYDEVAGTALTENDAAAARIDSKRAQVITLEDATTRGQRLAIGADGAVATAPSRFSTTTDSSVAASVTSVQLVAANANRKELTIQNDSSSILYIKEGTTASATDYKYKLYQDDVYKTNNYTGRVDGIWVSATGNARIAES